MPQTADPLNVVSLVSLAVLCVLGLRRLVRAEGLHALRAVFFTVLLWVVVFFLFTRAFPTLFRFPCLTLSDEENVYTITE